MGGINQIGKEVMTFHFCLKSDSHLPKKFLFIYFNESPLKIMKNAFYFILKYLLYYNLVRKQLQYTYCAISHEVKVTKYWNFVR